MKQKPDVFFDLPGIHLLHGMRGVFLMAKCILEAKDLRLFYGDRKVLDIGRLAVYEGEKIGLIGENGMGKTTLLRVLAGEVIPDEGTVRRMAPAAMIRQQGDNHLKPEQIPDLLDEHLPQQLIASAFRKYSK